MKIVTHVYNEDGEVSGSEVLEGDPAELVALMVARNVMYDQYIDGDEDDDEDCEFCGEGPCVHDEEALAQAEACCSPSQPRELSLEQFLDQQHAPIGAVAMRERIGEYEKSTMVVGPGEFRIDGKFVGEVLNGVFMGPEQYGAAGAAVNESSEAPAKELPADLLMNTLARSREQLLRSNHMKDEYGDLIDNAQALNLLGRSCQIVLGETRRNTPQGWLSHFGLEALNPEIDPNFYSGLTTEDRFLRNMLPHYTVHPTGPAASIPEGVFRNCTFNRDGIMQLSDYQWFGEGYGSTVEVNHG